MTRVACLMILAWLSGCSDSAPSASEHALVRYNDEWRQHQAAVDAQAIMQGMAEERSRQEELARSAR